MWWEYLRGVSRSVLEPCHFDTGPDKFIRTVPLDYGSVPGIQILLYVFRGFQDANKK